MRLLYENWQQFIVENKDSKRVAKAVIYIDDKILFLKNDQGWDLPGGHIKKEEDIKQGLAREIEEETGLQVNEKSIKDPVYRHADMNVYEIHLDIGVVRLSSEHDKYILVHPDNIEDIKLTNRFKRAVKKTFK